MKLLFTIIGRILWLPLYLVLLLVTLIGFILYYLWLGLDGHERFILDLADSIIERRKKE